MNIRLRAVLHTIGMFACIFAGASAVVALSLLGGVDPTLIFTVIIGACLVWTVYELMLSKLKMDEEIDEIQKRIDERLK
jgi:uncharacterized membrane protein YfcA